MTKLFKKNFKSPRLMFQNRKNISSTLKNLIFFNRKTCFLKNIFKLFKRKSVIITKIFADFNIKITISFVKFLIFFLRQEIPIRHIYFPTWRENFFRIFQNLNSLRFALKMMKRRQKYNSIKFLRKKFFKTLQIFRSTQIDIFVRQDRHEILHCRSNKFLIWK